MTVQKKTKSHPDVLNYFKELPFYNTYIEKPNIQGLKNNDLLSELPFYEEPNLMKKDQPFKGYRISYKVELFEKNDLLIQLETSKSSIKDLFNDILDETKSLQYRITLNVELKNTSPEKKLDFLQFILIQLQKQ